MIEFACPSCSQLLEVDDRDAGNTVSCPKCDTAIIVPKDVLPDAAASTLHLDSGGQTHSHDGSGRTSRKDIAILFVPSDIKNLPALIAKLRSRSDPVSNFLWERFSPTAQELLQNPDTPIEQSLPVAIDQLNSIIYGPSIFDTQRFASVRLSNKTRRLLALNPLGSDLLDFNRRLLEDVYPLELTNVHITPSSADPRTFLEHSLTIFSIAAAIVYATGFLVVTTFLDRFGVAEAGADVLKLTYLQVGILFFLFPVIVLLPITVFFHLRSDPHALTKMPTVAITCMANLLLVCYWFATFAHPGEFYAHRVWLACLFCWTVLLIASGRRLALAETSDIQWLDNLIEAVIDPLFAKVKKTTRTEIMRALFVIVVIILDLLIMFNVAAPALLCSLSLYALLVVWRGCYRKGVSHMRCTYITLACALPLTIILYCLLPLWPINRQELQHVFFYYFYSVIAVAFLWKEFKSIRLRYAGYTRYSAWGLRICILTALYYMSVLAFAYGIYPNIPVAKGGGNFVDTSDVRVYLRSEAQSGIPANICENITTAQSNLVVRTIQLRIIHASDTTMYLADPNDPEGDGGASMWSQWHTPKVFALQKDVIVTIEHAPTSLTHQMPTVSHAAIQHAQVPTLGNQSNPSISNTTTTPKPSNSVHP